MNKEWPLQRSSHCWFCVLFILIYASLAIHRLGTAQCHCSYCHQHLPHPLFSVCLNCPSIYDPVQFYLYVCFHFSCDVLNSLSVAFWFVFFWPILGEIMQAKYLTWAHICNKNQDSGANKFYLTICICFVILVNDFRAALCNFWGFGDLSGGSV